MSRMIAIHPENPQLRNITQVVNLLRDGAVAVVPTDSGYALACTLENKEARERICHIREVDKNHNFTLLCADLSELSNYARVDNQVFRLIKNNTPGPYTFILKATKEVPRKLMNEKRKTIGLRVPSNRIMKDLLASLNEPLMSVSLILPGSEVAENDPYEIEDKLGNIVDVIVDGGYLVEKPTTVINLSEDEVQIVRIGSGDITPFE
jgi:tRNA threonylcarbamoyl adenosine modification protein (Sua5/YciO/YrdC/YwlC family)